MIKKETVGIRRDNDLNDEKSMEAINSEINELRSRGEELERKLRDLDHTMRHDQEAVATMFALFAEIAKNARRTQIEQTFLSVKKAKEELEEKSDLIKKVVKEYTKTKDLSEENAKLLGINGKYFETAKEALASISSKKKSDKLVSEIVEKITNTKIAKLATEKATDSIMDIDIDIDKDKNRHKNRAESRQRLRNR